MFSVGVWVCASEERELDAILPHKLRVLLPHHEATTRPSLYPRPPE